MASHHLHHHHNPLPSTCFCNCNCFQTHHPSPSPSPPSSDPFLQALASHILHQSSQLSTHYPKIHSQFQSHFQFQSPNPPKQNPFHREEILKSSAISSLLSRIEALESSLHHVSVSSSNRSSYSLRDVAARTIQSRFRAFLVRRSRTLGQFKELAFIKSSFNSLKSSLSYGTQIDLNAVSLHTMDLLLHLDSIQGNDPMIRDSKRLISGDLVKFLEQIDNVTVKKNKIPLKGMRNLRLNQNVVDKSRVCNTKSGSFSKNQKETIEKLKSRVERISKLSRIYGADGEDLNLKRFHHVSDDEEESSGVFIKDENDRTRNQLLVNGHKIQPRVKKSVRFAENGNLFRILGNDNQYEGDSSDELGEDTRYEAEEIKEFSEDTEEEEEAEIDGGSPETSDGERKPRRKISSVDNYEIQGENGGSAFSAPLPVKMENKSDLMKIRKPLKILG